jgi:hypothetical protein
MIRQSGCGFAEKIMRSKTSGAGSNQSGSILLYNWDRRHIDAIATAPA